ncbi:hypothetical protein [Sideroxydans lithotrophicus]|uniref:Uncharacterized protein n=1 Tax=Sideroxydans lithotrophicus (strain ES-1) TaxID=580332 RepID=D5CT63_SIDLE|nr:hypothetical protein [Sideroxydans lithotrophicus]ADE12149.1 conserved hypothetical protein [Sideroxydans lithotrophicus ES-1]
MGNKVVHSVETPAGSTPNTQDRVILGVQMGVANGAGGGAGLAVVVAVAMAGLPANYAVAVNPGQDATWFVSGKTATGFNVTLTPRLAANTLAAGTFDVIVTG